MKIKKERRSTEIEPTTTTKTNDMSVFVSSQTSFSLPLCASNIMKFVSLFLSFGHYYYYFKCALNSGVYTRHSVLRK